MVTFALFIFLLIAPVFWIQEILSNSKIS